MLFRIYDHGKKASVSARPGSFDEAVTEARRLARREPDRFLEVQRLERDDGDTWVPTGWTFGVQGDWD